MNNEKIDRELGRVIEEWYEWVLKEITTKIAKDQMREYGPELLHFVILELYNKSPEYKKQLLEDKKVPYWLLTSSGLQLQQFLFAPYKIEEEQQKHIDKMKQAR
jgi:hypothetical protein